MTFMNRSGEVLDEVTASDAVIAVHDDLDLPEGRLRIRPRGGSGGHRGVASLIERLGDDFTRLRIGVGRPPVGVDAVDHVLAPLTPEAACALGPVTERACEAIESIITQGPEIAMSRFNAAPAVSTEPS
jgi:PTH1 family peptidyl-tRNA hydrolase